MVTTFVPPCAFGSILLMPSITLTSVVPSHFLNLKYCLLNFELIYPHPTTFAMALYETKNLAAILCSASNNGGWTTAQIPIFGDVCIVTGSYHLQQELSTIIKFLPQIHDRQSILPEGNGYSHPGMYFIIVGDFYTGDASKPLVVDASPSRRGRILAIRR